MTRQQLSTIVSGSGADEAQVALHSGLRNFEYHAMVRSQLDYYLTEAVIGGDGGADVGGGADNSYVELPLNAGANRAPFPGTLCAHVDQELAAPALAGTLRLKVIGRDQFNQVQIEETPPVVLGAVVNNYIYLAKVFSSVEWVGFQSILLDDSESMLNLGFRWDWTRADDASNLHIAGENLGLPLFGRVRKRPHGSTVYPRRQFEDYDPEFGQELGRIVYWETFAGNTSYMHPTVEIGAVASADWEGSIEKFRLTSEIEGWTIPEPDTMIRVVVNYNSRVQPGTR